MPEDDLCAARGQPLAPGAPVFRVPEQRRRDAPVTPLASCWPALIRRELVGGSPVGAATCVGPGGCAGEFAAAATDDPAAQTTAKLTEPAGCGTHNVITTVLGIEAMPDRALQTETINLRASADQKAMIDRAAQRLGKSRTEFVLDTLREASENVLLDQCLFSVDASAFDAFEAALDTPPEPNDALRRTLATPAPWDK